MAVSKFMEISQKISPGMKILLKTIKRFSFSENFLDNRYKQSKYGRVKTSVSGSTSNPSNNMSTKKDFPMQNSQSDVGISQKSTAKRFSAGSSRLSPSLFLGRNLGIAALVAASLMGYSAQAATTTWDSNGATTGVTDGSGTWNATGALWWNGASDAAWTAGNDAVIGNGNGEAGKVTVSGLLAVNTITFNAPGSGNYTLAASSGTVALAAGLTVNNDTTLTGPITLTGANNWTIASGKTLTLTNLGIVTNGANTLSLSGAGTLSTSSALTVNGVSSLSGALIVNTGSSTLSGAGSLLNISSITVTGAPNSATFVSSAAADTASTNRINTAATLTLGGANGGGAFTLTKAASGVNSQTFASLNLGVGLDAINNTNGANTLTFTGSGGAGYTRTVGGLINFGGNTVSFTNAPTAVGGSSVAGSGTGAILVGAVLGNADFVSATTGNVSAAKYTTNAFGAGANTNVTTGSSFSASGDTQSIKFAGGTSVVTISSGTSTITSGGILNGSSGSATITGGAIQAASGQELWIFNNSGGLTINSSIVDNNGSGLSKFGNNILTLGGANTFTGQVYLNAGTVVLNNADALGSGTAAINVTGASTLQSGIAGITVNRNAVIYSAQILTYNTNGYDATFAGSIAVQGGSSSGNLIKSGAGTLFYTGNTVGSNMALSVTGGALDVTGTIASTNAGWNTTGGATSPVINLHGNGYISIAGDWNFITNAGTALAPTQLTLNVSENAQNILSGRFFAGKANNSTAVVNQSGGLVSIGSLNLNAGGASGVGISSTYNLTGGILKFAYNGTSLFDTNSVLNLNGGTIQVAAGMTLNSSNSQTNQVGGVAGQIVVGANGSTIDVLNGNTFTINTAVNHDSTLGSTLDGGFTKTSAGTLVLGGANTFTGAAAINAGSLKLTNALALQNSTLALGTTGSLVFDSTVAGHAFTFGGLSGSTAFALTDNLSNAVALAVGQNDSSTTYSGILSGAGSLTKNGIGTLSLSANSTYTGATTVNAGKLAVNGRLAAGSAVTVNSGGSLGGSGTVGGSVNVLSGGHLAPGNSISTTFSTGALTLAAGSTTDVELGTASTSRTLANSSLTNDRTTVNGALSLNGTLNLINNSNAGSLGSAGAGSYLLFTGASSVSGKFTNIVDVAGYHAAVDSTSTAGNVYVDLNYYANAALSNASGGDLTQVSATQYSLNLGAFGSNSGTHTATITLDNVLADAIYQDLLSGGFDVSGKGAFTLSGFDATLSGITSGSNLTLTVSFNTDSASEGLYSGSVLFNPTSVNASGTTALTQMSLGLEFEVVPEPATWAMFVGGFGMLLGFQSFRRRNVKAARA